MKRILAIFLAIFFLFGSMTTAFAEGDANTTEEPVQTAEPTVEPTAEPTAEPTQVPVATATAVIAVGTPVPTATPEASLEPTATPKIDSATRMGYKVLDRCVTMGADLTDAQRLAVYDDFGIDMGSCKELKVTNKEEKEVLSGIISDKRIGSVALSCSFISTLERNSGLMVEIHNINYCTEAMYRNALVTAGVEDAYVVISAPYPVSGTGALTGIYKAYEKMTGTTLSSLAKALGAEELALTGELSEYIGSAEASQIIAELKNVLDQTVNMTDDEVRAEIKNIATAYNVSLSDTMVEQVLKLCRKFEGLDASQLQTELTKLAKTAETASNVTQAVQETVTRVYQDVKTFFESVGTFFTNLFNGSWRS